MSGKQPLVKTAGEVGQAIEHLILFSTNRLRDGRALLRLVEREARKREREAFRQGASWGDEMTYHGGDPEGVRDYTPAIEAEAARRYPEPHHD